MKEEEKINKQNQESIKKNSVREDLDNIVKDIKDISKSKFEQKDIFWIGPIIVMLMGILPWPIGYYTLLRIIVFGGSVFFSYQFFKQKEVKKTWIFGFFAILYNPIIPIYLHVKIIWIIINILTIYFFYINRKKI